MHCHFILSTGLSAVTLFEHFVLKTGFSDLHTLFGGVLVEKCLSFGIGGLSGLFLKILKILVDDLLSLFRTHFGCATVEHNFHTILE